MPLKPVFDPRIVCYFHYTDTLSARILKDAVPEGDVEIYASRGEALFNIDPDSPSLSGKFYGALAQTDERPEHESLPEAYVFDLSITPNKAYEGMSMAEEAIGRGLTNGNEDMQCVATAIELLATHQQLAEDGAPAPFVFLKKSADSDRIARILAENTGMIVNVFNKEWIHFDADPEHRGWEAKAKAFTSFKPLLEQTKAVSPTPKAQAVELTRAAA